jgi:ApaG protein
MISQISSGIKISVETNYSGSYLQNNRMHHAFSYQIEIENLTADTVQLESRHWDIFDALHQKDEVDGDGVVGKQPILAPGAAFTYQSGCLLASTYGAMKGHYTFVNFSTALRFQVDIPLFHLSAPFASN